MMCSLGKHQEGDDVKPPRARRHSDGSMTEVVRRTPRATLAEAKANKTAQLQGEIAAAQDVPFEPDMEAGQYEPIPPDQQQLPDYGRGQAGLPDPKSLWYSGAREP